MASQNPVSDSSSSSGEMIEPLIDKLPDIIDWLPSAVKPAWLLINQVPIVAGLIVVLFSHVTAILFRALLIRLLHRVSTNTDNVLDDSVIDCLRKPLFTTLMFFGLALGIKVSQLPFGTTILLNICVSVIVGSWMRSTFVLSTEILDKLGSLHHRFPLVEPRTVPLLDLTIKLVILLLGGYALLLIWGINPVGWLASAGIAGIAIGFAAKDTLANVFSGFFILIDAPYKVGDYVNLDSGERGCVTHIGLRSTRMIGRDDIEITLPNAVIANTKIVNESGGIKKNIRIAIAVGVAYGSDVDQVCELLQKIGVDHSEVCVAPSPRVRMRAFGASSLDFELLAWIEKPEDRGRIRHELLISTYKALGEQSIEIPYAKSDIYIKEIPSGAFNTPED